MILKGIFWSHTLKQLCCKVFAKIFWKASFFWNVSPSVHKQFIPAEELSEAMPSQQRKLGTLGNKFPKQTVNPETKFQNQNWKQIQNLGNELLNTTMKSTQARVSKPNFAKITSASSQKKIPAEIYCRENKAFSSQKQFWVSIEITRQRVEINNG